MIFGGVFKFSVGLIGISLAILVLVWGLVKKDNKKIRRAAVIFIVTWVLLLLVALAELLFVL